jgi:hypothetical protein
MCLQIGLSYVYSRRKDSVWIPILINLQCSAQLKPSLPVTGWNYGVQKSKDALHHTTKCVRGSAGLWESVVVMINKRRKLSA